MLELRNKLKSTSDGKEKISSAYFRVCQGRNINEKCVLKERKGFHALCLKLPIPSAGSGKKSVGLGFVLALVSPEDFSSCLS